VPSLADLDAVLIDSQVGVSLSLSPHFAVLFTPLRWLELSATAHSPQGTEIETGFSYVIATGIEQRASQRFVYGYLPWTFGLGAEVELLRSYAHTLGAAVTGTYALWSSYRDRHGERMHGDDAWNDAPAVSAALQHRVGPLQSALDVSFALSPVPEQTRRTSYVDGDRIGLGLGSSYTFAVMAQPAHVGVHAQFQRILPEHTHKDADAQRDEVPDDAEGGVPRGPIEGREGLQTNSPGFPGFSSDGWLLALGIDVGIRI
jgi:hypothetical protein